MSSVPAPWHAPLGPFVGAAVGVDGVVSGFGGEGVRELREVARRGGALRAGGCGVLRLVARGKYIPVPIQFEAIRGCEAIENFKNPQLFEPARFAAPPQSEPQRT